MTKEPNKKISILDISDIAPIVVEEFSIDDFFLNNKWKGAKSVAPLGSKNTKFPFGAIEIINESDRRDLDDPDGERPSVSDVQILSQELIDDGSGMVKVRVTFKIYNSSGQNIDGFEVALSRKV